MNTKTTRIHGTASVLLAGLLFPVLTYADALWPSVKYGMTVPQAAAALPQAKPVSGGRLVTGAVALLQLEKVSLADRTFAAEFYFYDNLLVQITVSFPEWESNETNLAIFEDLIPVLSAKYGKEFTRSVSARASGLYADATWSKNGETVALFITPVTQDNSMLKIVFRPVAQIPSKSRK